MTPVERTNAYWFMNLILKLAERYSFSVTSWIRTPTRNKAVGGLPNSAHLTGLGLDLVLDNVSDSEAFLKEAVEIGLHYEDPKQAKDHIHLEMKVK